MLAAAVSACAHAPATAADDTVVAGQLLVGSEGAQDAAAVLTALTLEGWQFEYVAAASETTHLVKVTQADGATPSQTATAELARRLQGRPGLRFVELNRVRQPR